MRKQSKGSDKYLFNPNEEVALGDQSELDQIVKDLKDFQSFKVDNIKSTYQRNKMLKHRKTVSDGTEKQSIAFDTPKQDRHESPAKSIMSKADIIQQVQQSPLSPLTPMLDEYMIKTPKLAQVNFQTNKKKSGPDSPMFKIVDTKKPDNSDLLMELVGQQQPITHVDMLNRSPRKTAEKKVVISKTKVLNAGFKGLKDHIRQNQIAQEQERANQQRTVTDVSLGAPTKPVLPGAQQRLRVPFVQVLTDAGNVLNSPFQIGGALKKAKRVSSVELSEQASGLVNQHDFEVSTFKNDNVTSGFPSPKRRTSDNPYPQLAEPVNRAINKIASPETLINSSINNQIEFKEVQITPKQSSIDLQAKNRNRPNTYRSQQQQTRRVSCELSKSSRPEYNSPREEPFYTVKPTEVILPLEQESRQERRESIEDQQMSLKRQQSPHKTEKSTGLIKNGLRASSDNKVLTENGNESSKEKIVQMHSKGTETQRVKPESIVIDSSPRKEQSSKQSMQKKPLATTAFYNSQLVSVLELRQRMQSSQNDSPKRKPNSDLSPVVTARNTNRNDASPRVSMPHSSMAVTRQTLPDSNIFYASDSKQKQKFNGSGDYSQNQRVSQISHSDYQQIMTRPSHQVGTLYKAMRQSIQKNSQESTFASGRNSKKNALSLTQYVTSKPLNVYYPSSTTKLAPECKGIGQSIQRFQSLGKHSVKQHSPSREAGVQTGSQRLQSPTKIIVPRLPLGDALGLQSTTEHRVNQTAEQSPAKRVQESQASSSPRMNACNQIRQHQTFQSVKSIDSQDQKQLQTNQAGKQCVESLQPVKMPPNVIARGLQGQDYSCNIFIKKNKIPQRVENPRNSFLPTPQQTTIAQNEIGVVTLGTDINASLDQQNHSDQVNRRASLAQQDGNDGKNFATNFIVRLRQLQSELSKADHDANQLQPVYSSVQLAEQSQKYNDQIFAMNNTQIAFRLSSRNAFFEVTPKIEDQRYFTPITRTSNKELPKLWNYQSQSSQLQPTFQQRKPLYLRKTVKPDSSRSPEQTITSQRNKFWQTSKYGSINKSFRVSHHEKTPGSQDRQTVKVQDQNQKFRQLEFNPMRSSRSQLNRAPIRGSFRLRQSKPQRQQRGPARNIAPEEVPERSKVMGFDDIIAYNEMHRFINDFQDQHEE